MKLRVLVLSIMLFLAAGTIIGQDIESWSSHYNTGNIIGYVGANINYTYSIGATGGIEYVISQFKAGDYMPLDITLGVRGFANFYMWYYTGIGFGAYPYVGMHLGMKDLFAEEELAWLNNLDYYLGLGFGLQFVPFSYYGYGSNDMILMFASHSGVNYFLSDNFAIFAEESWTWYNWYTTVGVLVKI